MGRVQDCYTHFAEAEVWLAKITPCFEIGKSTGFRDLTGGIGAGTTELHIVRSVLVIAYYVLIFLKCPQFIESGVPRMTGTAGQKRVPAEYFSHSPFPLPATPRRTTSHRRQGRRTDGAVRPIGGGEERARDAARPAGGGQSAPHRHCRSPFDKLRANGPGGGGGVRSG